MLADYIDPNQTFVTCPNQDVVYGLGFFSLDEEPVVAQVPDFGDRFWVHALYDARTDQFAELLKPYSTKPGFYLLAGPNWNGDKPAGIEDCGRSHPRAIGGFQGRADDMLNVRGVTLFPSAVEDAVRHVAAAGDEFEICVTRERELDVLTVRVEPAPAVGDGQHGELRQAIETEIVARCELRPVVEIVPPGTLPKSEFKAKRVRDLRS